MPQETPFIAPVPEAIQESINLAHAKVEVLRNEEIRLNKLKGALELEVASVSINKDRLDSDIAKAKEEHRVASTNVEMASIELARLQSEIQLANQELFKLKREKDEAVEAKAQAEAKRAELFASVHSSEEALEAQRSAFRATVDAFNARKAHIQELLQTL